MAGADAPRIWLAQGPALILGAMAGLGFSGWEAAVLQLAGLPAAAAAPSVVAGYAVGGALVGGVAAADGLRGGRWALAATVLLVGWLVGIPVAQAVAALGVPALSGVSVVATTALGFSLGQLAGRVPGSGRAHLGLAAGLLAIAAILAPVELHVLGAHGPHVGLVRWVAVAGGLGIGGIVTAAAPRQGMVAVPLLAWAGLGIVMSSAASYRPPRPTVAASRVDAPPVVIVTVAGLAEAPTGPHLRSLGTDSVVFTSAYATSNWVVPSVASLLTGRLPAAHGAGRNDGGGPTGSALRPDVPTLAGALRRQGWATAGFSGESTLRHHALDAGFETWVDVPASGALPTWLGPAAAAGLSMPAWELSPAGVVDGALDWIDRKGSRGWLLYVHLADARGSADADHDAAMAEADRQLGRIVAAVPDDAWIVVAGTHGVDHDGTHTVVGRRMDPEILHVPLVIRSLGTPAAQVGGAVSIIDVPATLLFGIGSGPLARADGAPLEPVFGGPLAERIVVGQSSGRGPEREVVIYGDHVLLRVGGADLLWRPGAAASEGGDPDDLRASMLALLEGPHAAGASLTPAPTYVRLARVGARVVGRR